MIALTIVLIFVSRASYDIYFQQIFSQMALQTKTIDFFNDYSIIFKTYDFGNSPNKTLFSKHFPNYKSRTIPNSFVKNDNSNRTYEIPNPLNKTNFKIECYENEDKMSYKQCYHKGDDEIIVSQYLSNIIKIISNITTITYTINPTIAPHNTKTTYNTKIKSKIDNAKIINSKNNNAKK